MSWLKSLIGRIWMKKEEGGGRGGGRKRRGEGEKKERGERGECKK